jgi:signal transduction histidine kinase
MRATGWLRRNSLEAACAVFIVADLAVMLAWPGMIRVPFFLTWLCLIVVYGFHPWSWMRTAVVVSTLTLATLAVILKDGFHGDELWGKLVTTPLLAIMFGATAWHAHRRAAAQLQAEEIAATRASMLERQRQFVYDASHELRTPVTIARGHLELLGWGKPPAPELEVALDELGRMERIIDRLLVLARAEQPDFLVLREVEIESFLGEVFMRWSELAERSWRFQVDVAGRVHVDPEALRRALDALLENAIKYTEPRAMISLGAHAVGGEIVIEVADDGSGVPAEAVATIFERFARADDARTRARGGAGLGLAIVAAIARGHGGHCSVERRDGHTIFALTLPVGALLDAEPTAERVAVELA